MWGHDLRRVGRIDAAIVQFRKADGLERAYYAAEGIDPALDWHHGHNLDLLATSYQHKGQMAAAERTLREVAALGSLDLHRAFNLRVLPAFLIHRARHEEALESARAMTSLPYAQARAVGHALAERTAAQMLDHDAAYGGSHLAMALVLQRKGDAAGATREIEAARRCWRDADPDLPELALLAPGAAAVRDGR